MQNKQVRVHYRRFYRNKQTPFNEPLSEIVATALKHVGPDGTLLNKVSKRVYTEQADGRALVLNGVMPTASNSVFGELLSYDPEANIPLLMHGADDSPELEIRQGAKPNDAEFLRGIVFFMLRGDHLVFIDQDLAAPALERYTRWLLATATPVTKDDRIQFIPSTLLGEEATLKRVRSIRLEPAAQGNNLFDPKIATSTNSADETSKTNIIDILKAAKFDSAVISRLVGDHNLAVKLKMTLEFQKGRTTTALDGQDAIALLRHVAEEDLIVVGDTARKRRGKLERLIVTDYVERTANMLDRADAWRGLERAFQTYKDSGYID